MPSGNVRGGGSRTAKVSSGRTQLCGLNRGRERNQCIAESWLDPATLAVCDSALRKSKGGVRECENGTQCTQGGKKKLIKNYWCVKKNSSINIFSSTMEPRGAPVVRRMGKDGAAWRRRRRRRCWGDVRELNDCEVWRQQTKKKPQTVSKERRKFAKNAHLPRKRRGDGRAKNRNRRRHTPPIGEENQAGKNMGSDCALHASN